MPIKYQRTVKTSNQPSQSPLNKQLINFLVRWEDVNLPVKSNISVVFLTDIIFFYYIRLKVSFLRFLFRSWVFKYLWKVFLLYYYVETTIWKISCGSWRECYFWLHLVSSSKIVGKSESIIRGVFTLRKKWSFPLRVYSVNVTKSAVSCGGFCHIYWRDP